MLIVPVAGVIKAGANGGDPGAVTPSVPVLCVVEDDESPPFASARLVSALLWMAVGPAVPPVACLPWYQAVTCPGDLGTVR